MASFEYAVPLTWTTTSSRSIDVSDIERSERDRLADIVIDGEDNGGRGEVGSC